MITEMTRDYDLMVGGELVLNCSLNSNQVEIDKKTYSVNSSQLYLRKKGVNIDSSYVKVIDDLTAQMRMPNANISDSGIYLCQLSIPELATDHLVCSSQVSVGYAPNPVKNFNCISKYYKNLTCAWEVEDSGVQTTYILFKRNYLFANFFKNPALQQCPIETMNNTYCQWRGDTDPPFEIYEKVFRFELQGNNSLGFSNQTFTLNHAEIFMPKSPESVIVGTVNKKNISIQWSPPDEIHGIQQSPLMYQMWLEELIGEKETKVFDIGIDVTSYTIFGLEPYMLYNISLRCRSKFANNSNLWSSFASVQTRTLPDVPYYIPEIVPEAFELHHYDGYRTVTLYWKPVSSKYYNGENFTYHIVYLEKNLSLSNMVPTTKLVNTTSLSITFTNLQENLSYSFHLYTLNKEGLSNTYKAIFVDNQDKIPDPPEDITAISYDVGHYRMSWKTPRKNASSIIDYVVFWCSSSKPWLNRCESPIQWLSTPLLGNNVTLNLSDSSTNFQFAVVARTTTTSSGMQWATCIVPSKAALSKIGNVIVVPASSTSLKVMWRLDCSAQKAVVQKVEIDYCKIDEKKKCLDKKQSLVISDSNLESYLIDNLIPFTNYSIIIRAYNQAGVASEDSDPRIQITMQGAPTDSPQNVNAVAIPGAALRVTWQKPLQANGVITRYILKYNNNVNIIEVSKDQESYEVQINNLLLFTYYNITLEACVGHFCSPKSKAVNVQTEIGVPGSMDPPRVEMINSTFTKVSWNRPLLPNGPLDFYEIQWEEVKNWNTSKQSKIVDQGLFTLIDMKCFNVEDGGIKYKFSVRAVNIRNGNRLYGSFSESSQVQACLLTQGLAMLIGAAIGGTLALAFVMLMAYKLIKWMSDKIHQVKSITVRLPKGLDGPETNPLNNYENFKNGLLPQATLNNNNIGRLSYIADDYDKNRHGSGSSQYSFTSTDELLYKTGKCTKFVRKPSGESSGCSSMSSNTTTKLQTSDSSTESDFMTPPSPDMAFPECSGLKGNLPTVMEAQDSLNSSSVLTEVSHNKNAEEKTISIADGIVLKVDQPYSKFGVSNHAGALPFMWMNPLTLYNNSLSNSEPSVTDIKEPVTVFAPYSKVGLAKSSSDILGLKQIDSDAGYSRCGIIATSKVDPAYPEFGRRLLPDNIKKKEEYSIKDLLEKYQCFDDNVRRKSDTVANGGFFHMSPFLTDVDVPLESRISEINGDNGYIKFRRPNSKPVRLRHGYVPFNELSNMSNLVSASSSLSTDELQKVSEEEAGVSTSDAGLQQNFHKSVDLLPNCFSSEIGAFPASTSDYANSPAHIEVGGEPDLGNLPKELAGDNGGPTVNQLHTADKRVSLLKEAEEDPTSLAQNFSHLETESQSMDLHPSENLSSKNLNPRTLPQNGYVSFAELWNLHSETDAPMPKVKKKIKDTALEGTQFECDPNCVHNPIVRSSSDQELPHSAKVNDGHQVHPMTSNIPRCKFASPHTESQSFPIGTCNGFSPRRLVNFGPLVESEICEV